MAVTHDDAASEAGRAMVARRWGTPSPVLSRAVATLSDRRGELDEALKAKLAEVIADPGGDDAR